MSTVRMPEFEMNKELESIEACCSELEDHPTDHLTISKLAQLNRHQTDVNDLHRSDVTILHADIDINIDSANVVTGAGKKLAACLNVKQLKVNCVNLGDQSNEQVVMRRVQAAGYVVLLVLSSVQPPHYWRTVASLISELVASKHRKVLPIYFGLRKEYARNAYPEIAKLSSWEGDDFTSMLKWVEGSVINQSLPTFSYPLLNVKREITCVDSQSAPSWATERSMLLESISSFFGTLHGDHNKAASVRTAECCKAKKNRGKFEKFSGETITRLLKSKETIRLHFSLIQ
ncbi:uncharacterized protein LOC134195225 [Corticium candelabrum]|uniref:uncharacterized protein LOC134195225 n=1 Tax=Corticium candelabrum TaxID=121492 RepID=UPI002E26CA65|nr:uncharacterized protein LOC134195225 [Corticium candelabrum]